MISGFSWEFKMDSLPPWLQPSLGIVIPAWNLLFPPGIRPRGRGARSDLSSHPVGIWEAPSPPGFPWKRRNPGDIPVRNIELCSELAAGPDSHPKIRKFLINSPPLPGVPQPDLGAVPVFQRDPIAEGKFQGEFGFRRDWGALGSRKSREFGRVGGAAVALLGFHGSCSSGSGSGGISASFGAVSMG